jgi:tetratricopeptide (TPR) repeat protein
MGGAGKTTLLRHLAAWWHTTGFVQRVFYFGYDEKAWTLQQLMTLIAQQLYGPQYYSNFQPLSPKAQQAMLAQDLRSKNHLLILDNLESISGAHLAIQHTLPQEEQAALRSFLVDLAKGHTLVLLGSRGGEDWLAKGTVDKNIYELPGLDPEAASTLADRILERNNAAKYRQDENLRKLIKVLDGFPLALEVVLANLAHQAPAQVLEALQAGDVKLDIDESKQQDKSIFEQKTKSILRCIDYSHSNISPEAQQLLLCLAPFTSVICQDKLDQYTEQLRKQSVLASLPYDRWPEVIQEAQNWGLLSSDSEIPGFLHLQPIFPYFLRNRLYAPEQREVRSAVETAFREHYDQLGDLLSQLLDSKEPQEQQVGQEITEMEYENLVTALFLALETYSPVENLFLALSKYLDTTPESHLALELGLTVLDRLERNQAEKLRDSISDQYIVIGSIGLHQLKLNKYSEAEVSYQKALSILLENKSYNAVQRRRLSADVYFQLGLVAMMQDQWQQAEQYYRQALQLYVEDNDRYDQAITYLGLGMVAQEQREFQQAEQYYQQALRIYDHLEKRYDQAHAYGQLGLLEQERMQWSQALDYFLRALEIFIADKNDKYKVITVSYIAQLWKASGNESLPAAVATILGASVEEIENLLRKMLAGE